MQIQKTKFRAGQTKTTLFSATTRCKTKLLFVRTCDKLRQVQNAIFCTSPLVAVFKETFFPLLPIAKQSCFCNKPATSCKTPYFALHACGCVQRNVFFVTTNCKTKLLLARTCDKLRQVQNAIFCTSPLVAVANIFTSVVCVRLVVIFTDAKLCLPNLPKRNSSRQG